MGFWLDSGDDVSANGAAIALTEQNHQLLTSIDRRLGQTSFPHTFSDSDECAEWAALLPSLKQTIKESVQSLAVGEGTTATSTPLADETQPPSQEQTTMYQSVKQRIYNYASSGEPLLEAMGNDPDFQQLSASQKQRLAREVVQRFNRGEITMSQLRGR